LNLGENQTKIQLVKSLKHLFGMAYVKMFLKYILILSFVLQIFGAVGFVGYLSFKNGQKAVKELAAQLENEICDRIEQHLDSYLTTPKQINQINLAAIKLDLLNLSKHFFWKQMRVFNVGYNNFAKERQKILSIGCDDFIRKPYTQEILLEKLSEHLGVKYINQAKITKQSVVDQTAQMFASEAELLRALSRMSPDWLEKIHHAAASCSDDLILDLIKQIPLNKSQIV
jgi:CheY-like chemotaxis protein